MIVEELERYIKQEDKFPPKTPVTRYSKKRRLLHMCSLLNAKWFLIYKFFCFNIGCVYAVLYWMNKMGLWDLQIIAFSFYLQFIHDPNFISIRVQVKQFYTHCSTDWTYLCYFMSLFWLQEQFIFLCVSTVYIYIIFLFLFYCTHLRHTQNTYYVGKYRKSVNSSFDCW